MKQGQRVSHPVHGLGTIVHVENEIKMGDNNTWDKQYQSSITKETNGVSRYTGHLNVAVRFDNGGPQGFAINASNEAKELQVLE